MKAGLDYWSKSVLGIKLFEFCEQVCVFHKIIHSFLQFDEKSRLAFWMQYPILYQKYGRKILDGVLMGEWRLEHFKPLFTSKKVTVQMCTFRILGTFFQKLIFFSKDLFSIYIKKVLKNQKIHVPLFGTVLLSGTHCSYVFFNKSFKVSSASKYFSLSSSVIMSKSGASPLILKVLDFSVQKFDNKLRSKSYLNCKLKYFCKIDS